MTTDERIAAISQFGFTERQARFLVTVLLHAGVCVPRQYATFAGTAYGHKVNMLFDRLVECGYATRYPCLHNRARLYHLHHHELYRAIGEPHSRYRRPVPAGRAVERVMLLDGILGNRQLAWLANEEEKLEFFRARVPALSLERLPHALNINSEGRRRLFPDASPIGVESSGRVVFLYLVTTPETDPFRAFLYRHAELLRALPEWTLQLLLPSPVDGVGNLLGNLVRAELATPLSPLSLEKLRWYFEQWRVVRASGSGRPSDPRFRRAQRAFGTPRFSALYRHWLADGDSVFELVSSTTIGDALTSGWGRIECRRLPSYRYLSPLVDIGSHDGKAVEGRAERRRRVPRSPKPVPLPFMVA